MEVLEGKGAESGIGRDEKTNGEERGKFERSKGRLDKEQREKAGEGNFWVQILGKRRSTLGEDRRKKLVNALSLTMAAHYKDHRFQHPRSRH